MGTNWYVTEDRALHVQAKLPVYVPVQKNAMSADRRPMLVKREPPALAERAFWTAVRQALLLLVSAIERRHLRHTPKSEIDRNADVV